MSFIDEWTAELRSANRRQTTGQLAARDNDGEEYFCCLGVAMDMLADRGIVDKVTLFDDYIGYRSNDDTPMEPETGILLPESLEYIGVDSLNPAIVHDEYNIDIPLSELNDNGFTFDQIADLIDYFLKG